MVEARCWINLSECGSVLSACSCSVQCNSAIAQCEHKDTADLISRAFRIDNLRLQTLFVFRDFSTISHKQSEVTNPMFVFSDFSSISHRQSEVTNPVRFP